MHTILKSSLAFRKIPFSRRAAAVSTPRYTSTMHDNDPEVLEREKKRNLSNVQHKTSTPHDHAPGWNEYIATTSEAAIKADGSTVSISDLQRKTIKHVHARHSSDDRIESHEASYTHDSIQGPLSGAQGKENNAIHHEEKEVIKKARHDKTSKRG